MLSLAHLSDAEIDLIYRNLNQHQVLALAPLHSKFYLAAKIKLYYYIYIYDILEYTRFEPTLLKRVTSCPLPNFRFPKYMNTYSTNNATIVSLQSFEKNLTKMDPNQTIVYMVFSQTPHPNCVHKVTDYFKTIENFIAIRQPDILWPSLWDYFARCFQNTRHYAVNHEVSPPRCLFALNTYIGDARYHRNNICEAVNVNLHLGIPRYYYSSECGLASKPYSPPTSKTLGIHLHGGQHSGRKFAIFQHLNTSILRTLCITISDRTTCIFSNGELETYYPNLQLLGIDYKHWCTTQEILQSIPNAIHQTLRYLTIATPSFNDALVKRICELPLQFPNASINWWSSYQSVDIPLKLICHQQLFSPIMPPRCIAINWTHSVIDGLVKLNRLYVAEKNGVAVEVEFKKHYSDDELMLLDLLYFSVNLTDSIPKVSGK